MVIMATRLGMRLRQAREKLGHNRSFVARQAGIDPSMLFRMENSAKSAPTFESVRKVAEVLGVSLDWLAQGSGEAPIGKARVAASRKVESVEKARALMERALECLAGDMAAAKRREAPKSKNKARKP